VGKSREQRDAAHGDPAPIQSSLKGSQKGARATPSIDFCDPVRVVVVSCQSDPAASLRLPPATSWQALSLRLLPTVSSSRCLL